MLGRRRTVKKTDKQKIAILILEIERLERANQELQNELSDRSWEDTESTSNRYDEWGMLK
jgi:hypothetical protein